MYCIVSYWSPSYDIASATSTVSYRSPLCDITRSTVLYYLHHTVLWSISTDRRCKQVHYVRKRCHETISVIHDSCGGKSKHGNDFHRVHMVPAVVQVWYSTISFPPLEYCIGTKSLYPNQELVLYSTQRDRTISGIRHTYKRHSANSVLWMVSIIRYSKLQE